MKGTVKQCCVLGCCCSSWCGMRRISELSEVVWLDQGSLWNSRESILWWKYNLFSVFTVTAGGVGKLCWSLLCLLFTPWNVTVSGPCRAFLAKSCHLSSRILHYQCPKLLVSTLFILGYFEEQFDGRVTASPFSLLVLQIVNLLGLRCLSVCLVL